MRAGEVDEAQDEAIIQCLVLGLAGQFAFTAQFANWIPPSSQHCGCTVEFQILSKSTNQASVGGNKLNSYEP